MLAGQRLCLIWIQFLLRLWPFNRHDCDRHESDFTCLPYQHYYYLVVADDIVHTSCLGYIWKVVL
jgi:hypothetical protein